jgi:hypothetical protein
MATTTEATEPNIAAKYDSSTASLTGGLNTIRNVDGDSASHTIKAEMKSRIALEITAALGILTISISPSKIC